MEPFEIPAFGFIELSILFSPEDTGMFAGDLIITSDDMANSPLVVSLTGKATTP